MNGNNPSASFRHARKGPCSMKVENGFTSAPSEPRATTSQATTTARTTLVTNATVRASGGMQ